MTNDQDAETKIDNCKTGRLAGTGAGVIAGAQIGTVLLPIPVIGTFAGALVGGMLGNKIGKRYGGAILDKMDISDRTANNAGPSDLTKEIERLRKMRDAGVLTEEEFTAAKAKLLGL